MIYFKDVLENVLEYVILLFKEHKSELFKLLAFIYVLLESHDHYYSPKDRSLSQWCLYHWTFNIVIGVLCDLFQQWLRGVCEVSVNLFLCDHQNYVGLSVFRNEDGQMIPNWLQ